MKIYAYCAKSGGIITRPQCKTICTHSVTLWSERDLIPFLKFLVPYTPCHKKIQVRHALQKLCMKKQCNHIHMYCSFIYNVYRTMLYVEKRSVRTIPWLAICVYMHICSGVASKGEEYPSDRKKKTKNGETRQKIGKRQGKLEKRGRDGKKRETNRFFYHAAAAVDRQGCLGFYIFGTQVSGMLISGLHVLISGQSGHFTLYKRIGTCTYTGNFQAFQDSLTKCLWHPQT